MELGRIKDQLDTVLDRMETVDPASEDYEVLTKRANDLRRIIQDEEKAREEAALELSKVEQNAVNHDEELEERKKDRLVKIFFGVGAGILGVASIFADETRVVCKSGLETIDKIRRIVH